MVIGEFSPNYRKYAISYLSILFNNSALQFWCTVHLRLLRTPLVSPSPSECHSGIYKGRQCTEDIGTLSTLVGCPSSLITLEDPGLEIFVSLSCFSSQGGMAVSVENQVPWNTSSDFSKEIQFPLGWWTLKALLLKINDENINIIMQRTPNSFALISARSMINQLLPQ